MKKMEGYKITKNKSINHSDCSICAIGEWQCIRKDLVCKAGFYYSKNNNRQFKTRKEAAPYIAVFIRNMESKFYYQIKDVDNHAVWITPQFDGKNRITFKELFTKFEFEDCTPCGIKETK